jgi:hypothetical protein
MLAGHLFFFNFNRLRCRQRKVQFSLAHVFIPNALCVVAFLRLMCRCRKNVTPTVFCLRRYQCSWLLVITACRADLGLEFVETALAVNPMLLAQCPRLPTAQISVGS